MFALGRQEDERRNANEAPKIHYICDSCSVLELSDNDKNPMKSRPLDITHALAPDCDLFASYAQWQHYILPMGYGTLYSFKTIIEAKTDANVY